MDERATLLQDHLTTHQTVKRIREYLAICRLSGSYKHRDKIPLGNQSLARYFEEGDAFLLAAVMRGIRASEFCEAMERELGPTVGRSMPERFERFLEK